VGQQRDVMHPDADRDRRDNAAVIVIDAQNDFCHPEGLLAQQGRDVSGMTVALPRLGRFLDHARSVGIPVVFIRNMHGEGTDTPAWLARHADPDRAQSCQEGSWGAEFCVVGPATGDTVLVKHRYSAFAGTTLEALLRERGLTNLFFTGFTTNVCVESSVREAICRDFLTTVVEDCCAAYGSRAHERSLEAMRVGFGATSTSDELIARWGAGDHVPTARPERAAPSVQGGPL
jgi:ureidoacrylate peracid hydrolase